MVEKKKIDLNHQTCHHVKYIPGEAKVETNKCSVAISENADTCIRVHACIKSDGCCMNRKQSGSRKIKPADDNGLTGLAVVRGLSAKQKWKVPSLEPERKMSTVTLAQDGTGVSVRL